MESSASKILWTIVITTLIVVSAFEPMKARMRLFVDRRLKGSPDDTLSLLDFDNALRAFLEYSDRDELLVRVGPYRRSVLLPDTLRGRKVADAALRDGALRVLFAH